MSVNRIKTVSGSTIVEVVTGLSLIAMAVGLTIVVFSKTMDNSNLYIKHQSIIAVNEMIISQSKVMNYNSEEKELGDVRIVSSIEPFQGHDSLVIVTYSASLISTGKLLYSRRLIKKTTTK